MGAKSTTSDHNSKSSTWLLSWFSQLTKQNTISKEQAKVQPKAQVKAQTNSFILPWKKENMKAAASSSVVITSPINVPCSEYSTSSFGSATIRKPSKVEEALARPSITISLSPSTERRNSQQTSCSSVNTTESQYSYSRRDSNSDRSIISELWTKARRRHPHYPKFHWPNRKDETQQLMPSSNNDYYESSLPSSFRQHHFPKHLKRHSISSSLATNDNTPYGSRPNSIIYPSQPTSPNFVATLLNNEKIDSYWLNQEAQPKLRWDIKHELTKLAIDGLFSNPELVTRQKNIEKQVLQIGSGDSSWGIDIASHNSRWNVIGLHDNCITTRAFNSVKNFKFMQCDNLLQGLKGFPNQSFDFIASRFLLLGYTFHQYQQLISECIRISKPGGIIEVIEMDLRIYNHRLLSCSITQLLNTEVFKVIESKGLDPRLARCLQDLILDQDIQSESKYISLPLGVWGGKLGVLFRDDVHTLIESFQKDIADMNEKDQRSEDELEYKIDIMDVELDSNRAFMNLHIMVIHI